MTLATFTNPLDNRYFEDYPVGAVFEFGSAVLTEAEIIEFALRFDAQSFHVDPTSAQRSVYGGLIASGWHTGSIMMRLLVEHFISTVASMGSPGIDALRWPRPVRAGDELRLRVTILESRLSNSKPDRGIVKYLVEVLNQLNEVVMEARTLSFIGCRAAGVRQ
jgi:acyl dehydratase